MIPSEPVVRSDRADGSATRCHALRVRLAGPLPDATAARWQAVTGTRLWTEPVPAGSAAETARRVRNREMRRPLHAGHSLRGVLVAGEGVVDLIVVARRDVLDRDDLHRLVAAITTEGPAAPSWPDPRRCDSRPVTPAFSAPSWGFGDPRRGRAYGEMVFDLDPQDIADEAAWSAALSAVLARYDSPSEDSGVLLVWTGAEYLPFQAPPAELTFFVGADDDGRCRLTVWHRLRSVSDSAAAQVSRHLIQARRSLSGDGRAPGDAEILDAPERQRILDLGRARRTAPVSSGLIGELFREQASATPDAVALSDEDSRWTYAELERYANRIAHGLRQRGVADGERVGVCGERTGTLVAAALGVLKAGAVYVPLDPGAPAERLRWSVADAGLRLVVTAEQKPLDELGAELVPVSELEALGDGSEDKPPAAGVSPPDPAYVIYTSGSTGRPKGVLVAHDSVVALLDATREQYQLGPSDVWTFFHSLAFDFSVWEIWGCLLTGGHLVVVPYWVSRSPSDFRALLAERQVTVVSQTPSAFAQLAEADRTHPTPLPLRLVVLGGETLHPRTVLPWLDRYPGSRCRLVNMFGITETTVHVTEQLVDRGIALEGSRSVGRPLPGWHVRIMDDQGRIAPPGVAGEIWVGGRGVALGYLHRPDLDAQRFVDDPAGDGRLYRSGDRGRLRPDGCLEHLGRIDNQIKLRGFRIELDEIRSVLTECPGVTAAAVTVRRLDPQDAATDRLDAYVVLDGTGTQQVRAHLARLLPEYMMPSAVVEVAALPLTRNGKVALDELPRAEPTSGPAEPAFEASDGPLTVQLQEVWQQLFGVTVAAGDDFFELGGNSLLAVRMTALMRERGMPPLHPRTLYLNPTITRLADALRTP